MSVPVPDRRPAAVVFGCAGLQLDPWECDFFRDVDPLGLILFARNVESPDQIRRLVAQFRDVVGRADAPVLIDQEGGRVARLRPPHWRAAPTPMTFAELYRKDRAAGIEAACLNARLLADELFALGITVDCAPVLDLPKPGADPIIGDRAYGDQPDEVIALARAACEGFLAGGVLPVIKHIPGHGRADVDSHKALPVVTCSRDELETSDFVPFRALWDQPWAMTAHVVYRALDAERPATLSPSLVAEVIRGHMGFDGVLVSDDLSMEALSGTFAERAAGALAAGCDLALHCNGKPAEMTAVAEGLRAIDAAGWQRVARAEAMRGVPQPFDRDGALARLDTLLARLEP